MNIERKPIVSSADLDNLPWYEFTVNGLSVIIETDIDGGGDKDLSGQSVDVITDRDSVVAVDATGDLICYPIGEGQHLRAHLGWYNANDDTLTLLEFVDQ